MKKSPHCRPPAFLLLGWAAIFLTGCIATVQTHKETSDAVALQGYQNDYDALLAKYKAACPIVAAAAISALPQDCIPAWRELRTFEADLHAAARALSFGGDMPLQMSSLKVDDAAAKKAMAALPAPLPRQVPK